MVFKRRNKRPFWQAVGESFYPKRGWKRAFNYIRHRLHRLPDQPHRIARGIFIGVLVTFSPFFGLHFALAALFAVILRANILAALLATFFGNPVTFPIIATVNLKLGRWLLGVGDAQHPVRGVLDSFMRAGIELKANIYAIFTNDVAHWASLRGFYDDVFLPYLLGGLIPGLITAVVAYYVALPALTVYQSRRKGRLKKKLAELKQKASKKADANDKAH